LKAWKDKSGVKILDKTLDTVAAPNTATPSN
jgi:hypothetical protein